MAQWICLPDGPHEKHWLNLDAIAHVHELSEGIVVHFVGGSAPLKLTKAAGKQLLAILKGPPE